MNLQLGSKEINLPPNRDQQQGITSPIGFCATALLWAQLVLWFLEDPLES
jgi:hypothetical protein